MTRRDALAALQTHADAVCAMGATTLYFSARRRRTKRPRKRSRPHHRLRPAGRFNAFDLVGIKPFLEARLGSSVDITTRDSLHPQLLDRIEQSAVRVF